MRCDGTRALAVLDRDPVVADLETEAHVRSCPRCRAELALQRRLRASLHELGATPMPGELRALADGLLAGIFAVLDEEDHRVARRSMRALGAAAVVGGMALGAGLVALARGRRPLVA